MKHLKLPMASLLILAVAVVLASGVSAKALAAHGGGDDAKATSPSSSGSSGSGSSGGASTETSHKSSSQTTSAKTETEHATETETEHATEVEVHHSTHSELRQSGQDDLAKLKQKDKKALSDADRAKVCEAHKKGLTKKFDRIVTNSQRIQTRIDGILDKAIAYKDSASLSPANWDSLVATAQSNKSASAASITTLQGLQPTLDCNNTSVPSDIATFKAAAKETRDNLKAYRDSVKAVLKSLSDAKEAASTEGSN